MSSITTAWIGGNGGDWSDPNNWSEPNPNPPPPILNYVPGLGNEVVLSALVTYDNTDEIYSLDSSSATLDMTGGSLTIDDCTPFQGTINVGAGASLILAPGADVFQPYGFTNSGTVTVDSGDTLQVGGTYTLGGTIDGAGTPYIGAGGGTITMPNITIGSIYIAGSNGGAQMLENSLSRAGDFTIDSNRGQFGLNGYTLISSGASDALSGDIGGPGTLLITGTTNVGDASGNGLTVGTLRPGSGQSMPARALMLEERLAGASKAFRIFRCGLYCTESSNGCRSFQPSERRGDRGLQLDGSILEQWPARRG
jgi:hypothetical protein